MAKNRIAIDARPEEVFDVLLDVESYAYWVVGAKEVRAVDPIWPARGACLHHSVGTKIGSVDDRTEILELRAPEILRLRAYARPLGIADVTISVRADDGRCEVVIEEVPVPGTKAAKLRPLLAPLIYVRNVRSLQRLRKLVIAKKAK